jgi:hypothetical protein
LYHIIVHNCLPSLLAVVIFEYSVPGFCGESLINQQHTADRTGSACESQ